MKHISLWQDINTKNYPKLTKDINVDILIIGGGITGVSTFYHLKKDTRKIALVDKNKIGFGATSRSTAKITFLQENIYSKLKDNFNIDVARKYYRSQKLAINEIVSVVKKENIACDLESVKSYLYTFKEKEINTLKKEREILTYFGEKINDVKTLPNNMDVAYGFSVPNTYVFHPLKFVSSLAKASITDDHQIYENTNIVDIKKKDEFYYCYTNEALIKSRYVVLAMHYPFFLFPYFFPLKCHLEKSFLIASNAKDKLNFSAINISNPYLSLRYYKDTLLTVGATTNLGFDYDYLKMVDSLKTYANKDIKYIWSNHDIMSLDNLPYIGYLKDFMYLATGFNTWGMTNGFLAGIILKSLLSNEINEYASLFDPKRGLSPLKLINYPFNLFGNIYSFTTSKLNKNKGWYHNNPKFTKINGKNVAIFKDDKGIYHTVLSTCPHVYCSLIFNQVEQTWDCPCHGSRFTLDGKCLFGPSTADITFKYR